MEPATPAVAVEPIRDTASRLSVSKQTVYRLISAGELRAIRIGAARRVVSSDVDALIARRLQAEAS